MCLSGVFGSEDLAAAFARHQAVFGRLDICVNNAGVGGVEPFYEVEVGSWRKVIEVNLIALIDGTSKAVDFISFTRVNISVLCTKSMTLSARKWN